MLALPLSELFRECRPAQRGPLGGVARMLHA